MMIIARGSGAPEPVAPFRARSFAQRDATVDRLYAGHGLPDEFEIGRLFGAQICRALE